MGNVYMEADQVRFKNSTYHNLQTAVTAALEGGGGGGTTVVANPEGSATVDLAKLQVGTTIYGIPAEAGDISYDNTSSGMTADDVQEAIDELNTGIGGISELIPSDATSSNKLATADDIPGVATTLAPGIVQPDGTTITIVDGVISAVGGGATYSATETVIGTWMGQPLYRKVYHVTEMPNASALSISSGLSGITKRNLYGSFYDEHESFNIPHVSLSNISNSVTTSYNYGANSITITDGVDRHTQAADIVIEYTKNSENP